MNDAGLTDSSRSEDEMEAVHLALDHQGIPILNEIVDPETIQPESSDNTFQQDFLFCAPEPADRDAPASQKPTLVRSELIDEMRRELLAVIETTSQTVANKIRDDLAATLKEALVEAIEKRLQAISGVETDHSANQRP